MRAEAKRCVENFKSEYADTFCRIGEVLLSFSSGILTVVTFGTSFWLKTTTEKGNVYHSGLWQNCTVSLSGSNCNTLGLTGPGEFLFCLLPCCPPLPLLLPCNPPLSFLTGYLTAARLFMCLALITGVCAWVISIIGLLQHRALWLFLATLAYGLQGSYVHSNCAFVAGML